MKTHLPALLRKALLSALAVYSVSTASAAVMHSGVSMITYTDFGQNVGRSAVGETNALLSYIRKQEGGVLVTYVYPEVNAAYKLPYGMIDFSSQNDGGYGVAIGYNFYATVRHNDVHNNTYTGNYIGNGNAIHYQTIEYRNSNVFRLTPANDYKIGRQSKLITDVTGSTIYNSDTRDWQDIANGELVGQSLYRAGSGTMQISSLTGEFTHLSGGGYIIGGISVIISTGRPTESQGSFTTKTNMGDTSLNAITEKSPIPFFAQGGDSGSPAWIWNDRTGRFEYLTAAQGIVPNVTFYEGAPKWTLETMDSFSVNVNLAASEGEGAHGAISEVHLGAVETQGETHTDSAGITATTWKGHVYDSADHTAEHQIAEFIGVKSGINTWQDLSSIKDTANWFNYSNEKLNSALSYADLFFTNDLVFTAGSATTTITADSDVDLGIGYIRLCKGELNRARFNIQGPHLINSAGYIVDSGVDAYITLTNPDSYMYEWRAIVEEGATLHIEGTGDTNALLNIGRGGTTYLNRTGGYAAYNVLANNGARVVISDLGQIQRDFTFGFRGGVLDMNGQSMTWNNGNNAEAAGFTIHALDEQAKITNAKAGTTTTLTWTQGGSQEWLGSFVDEEDGGALKFIYNGGADGVLTMHSIHTDLHHEGSGISVQSGKLELVGTNTIHGKGSVDGRSGSRYFNNKDWHYADVTSPVTVEEGATFELGSHARLTGNVTVDGGTFIMHEGVQHQWEYIEGGQTLEDTYAISAFYGLTGGITLRNGVLDIRYSEGTTSTNSYAGAISGSGTLTIDTGIDGGLLVLSGANTMTGTRSVTAGGLILTNAGAFDTSGNATGDNAWHIGKKSWLAAEGVAQTNAGLLAHIRTGSDGTLALTQDAPDELDMSRHPDLFIGAEAGKTVEYGSGSMEGLAAWHTTGDGRHQWLLGGGGGELVVSWLLTGDNDIVLGNPHMGGTVTLANVENNFTGRIIFTEGSNVVLSYTNPRALGGAQVDLSYGRAMSGSSSVSGILDGTTITPTADGILLLDDARDTEIDLSSHRNLHLGANGAEVRFGGDVAVWYNGSYKFGGPGGLVLEKALRVKGVNDLVVDAQGFSGGSVALAAATGITGTVTVMGHDAYKADTTGISRGDISLILAADDTLAHAAGITAQDGGTLLVAAGTTQHVNRLVIRQDGAVEMGIATTLHTTDLQMGAGSILAGINPSSAAVQVEGGSIAGTVNVGTIVKTGSGVLSLAEGHQITVGTLEVREGALSLDSAPSIAGTVQLHSGSTVNFNGRNLTSALDVAQGETAVITGDTIGFRSAQTHLASGGTLDLRGVTTVNLQLPSADSGQTFGGTLVLKNTTLKNGTGVNNMTYEFAHLHVDNGEAKLAQGGWNTFWNIHSLTGEGSFTWDSGSTHSTSNVLTLDGGGDFSGTIHFFRNHSGSRATRRFQAFTAIGHDYAVQSAVVKMTGTDNDNYGALAINTAEAHMKGLTTDANNKNYNVIYAGAALTTPQDGAPASTREAALHLDVDGGNSFTFRGGVSGDAAHALSVIKSGAGSQTFADGDGTYSTAATFRDVTVLGGTLNLTHTTTTITGDYAIAQGATLNVNGGITLAEGHTLAALATAGDTGTATLGSALTLAGGTLSFSGEGLGSLAENTYLLSLASVGKAEGQTGLTVDFMDASYLQAGRTYLLAGGDFASLELTYTATGVDFLTASFSATQEGLSITWNALPDNLIWDGTDSAHTWTASVFGTQGIPDGTFTSQDFLFTNAAANKNVVVGDELSDIKGMDISGSGYTFSGGAVSVAGGLTLRANASATFAQALHVGGDVSLADASKLILAAGESVFSLANESTGTLEVQSGASADLGSVQGTANYHLAGSGDISLTVGDAMYIFASTGNEFNGKLTIDLGTSHHFLMGEDNATGSNFAAGYRPNLVLKGGNASNAGLILNNCYAGADHALEIGSLSSGDDKFNVHIRGDWGDNPSGQAYRFVSVHQDTDTDFRGIFDDKTDKGQLRSIGLIMNGAGGVGGGTLTLLGNSQSTATLTINSGTVAIAGTGGHWNGDVVVNGGGQLFIQRTSGALNAGKSLTITGNGVAEFTDASGTLHEARPGALKLANGVDLAPSVTVPNPGASVMTEQNVTAAISGAITGSGNLTKIGAGTLKLSGTSTGTGHLDVEQGTLTLVNGSTWAGDIIVENGANLNTDGTGVFNVGGSITRDYRSGTHSGPISALATGTPSTINIGDGTAINLIGGDFSGVGRVIGGVLLTAGSNGKGAHISGVSQVNLDGTDLSGATLYGGSELNQYQCTQGISSEKTEVNLRSGSVNTVYGGHLMDSSGSGNLQNVSLGSALVTLDGATVSGNIYGGSRVIRNNNDSTVTQGAVTVDLNSGSLAGSVYAGGKQEGSSKLQTASTEVKISNGVSFTGTNQTISGGYEVAEGKSGSTITGGRTLTLSSEGAYTNLGGLAFKEFDIIDSSATSATLAGFTNTGSLVKKGEGAVTISPAQSLGTLTVEAGSIGFSGGAAFTGAVTVAEGATLSLTGAISLSSAISSNGTVDFSNVRFSLSAQDFTDNRFDILTGNGTSTGNLTLADITLDGISDPVRLLGMGGGNVYVILGAARSLVWNGAETDSGKLWSGANWLNNNAAGASFTGGDNVTFTAAAGCKRVDVGAEGVVTSDMAIANAAEYAFEGAAVNVSGNLSLEANAKARFHNSLAVQGSVSLASGSTLSLHQNTSLTVAANDANTGTLEVYNGAAVDLGDVSGTAKYHLDGAGTVRMNVTGRDYILSSTGNTFSGKLEINLGGRHFIIGADGNAAATFAEDATPDLVLSGGSGSSQFIINSNYHGTDHVLNIGSLASESASVDIHAQNGANPDNEDHRYLSIHQDTDTTYAGRFLNAGKQGNTGGLRGAGLIMNGTGTLTLTGNNNSMADLIASSGTVALSGSGYWKGDVTVGPGGQLYLQRDGALNNAQSLTISGNGVAAFTDASGVYHAARAGALKLDDGRVLAHAVTIGEGGASIATVEGATATISGAISGGALTKAGDGTLRLTGAVTAESISVADGTLSLGGNVTLNSAIANDSIVDFSGVRFTLNAGTSSGDRYDIVTGGGTTTGHLSLDAITISGVADTSTLRLAGVGTGHVFVLAGAGDLTWNGSLTEGGGTWGGLNWTMGSDNTGFRTGDNTYFTAAAANKDVEVTAGGVSTDQMVISANGYTFTGGAITATGGLTLAEDVTATFANDGLTVEGALTVQGESATLSVAEGKTVTISGTATGGGLVVAGGGTVSISATGSVSNNVSVAAGSRLDLASGTSLASGTGLTLAGTLGLADGVTLGNTLSSNNGAIAVETGATATFTGASSGSLTKTGEGTLALSREGSPAYGTWNLDAGTLRMDRSGSIVLNTGDTHTGTLEVATGKTINLGTVSGDVFYHLAGSGTINLTANGGGHVYLKSTGNTFSGTLNIALSGKHVIIGEENNSAAANFTASAMPDLVLTGGSSGSMLILNSNYHGEDSVFNIGSLTGGASVTISAANGTNPNNCEFRYVSVHQDKDTTFAGKFENTAKGNGGSKMRAVGLIMNGAGATGGGTLTITADNDSTAGLIINSGTVQLGEAGGSTGKWSGDVTVKNGGQLSIQRTDGDALVSGKTLRLAGTGVARWCSATA